MKTIIYEVGDPSPRPSFHRNQSPQNPVLAVRPEEKGSILFIRARTTQHNGSVKNGRQNKKTQRKRFWIGCACRGFHLKAPTFPPRKGELPRRYSKFFYLIPWRVRYAAFEIQGVVNLFLGKVVLKFVGFYLY